MWLMLLVLLAVVLVPRPRNSTLNFELSTDEHEDERPRTSQSVTVNLWMRPRRIRCILMLSVIPSSSTSSPGNAQVLLRSDPGLTRGVRGSPGRQVVPLAPCPTAKLFTSPGGATFEGRFPV
jgi:hypothetical protein